MTAILSQHLNRILRNAAADIEDIAEEENACGTLFKCHYPLPSCPTSVVHGPPVLWIPHELQQLLQDGLPSQKDTITPSRPRKRVPSYVVSCLQMSPGGPQTVNSPMYAIQRGDVVTEPHATPTTDVPAISRKRPPSPHNPIDTSHNECVASSVSIKHGMSRPVL